MEAQIKAFGKLPALNEDSRFEIGVLPAQKSHIMILNKASTNIIAHNGT
jgi:hypothetical protein